MCILQTIILVQYCTSQEDLGEKPDGHQANYKNSGDIVSVIVLIGLLLILLLTLLPPIDKKGTINDYFLSYVLGTNEKVWDKSQKVTG